MVATVARYDLSWFTRLDTLSRITLGSAMTTFIHSAIREVVERRKVEVSNPSGVHNLLNVDHLSLGI